MSDTTDLGPIFDSQKQCASVTGFPKEIMKAAQGCLAFRNGRVYLYDLLKWYFSRPEMKDSEALDLTQMRARLAEQQAIAKEFENREQDAEWVRVCDVEQFLTEKVVSVLRAALISMPTIMDVRTNPHDPELSRKELTVWSQETLKLLRDKIPKENGK